MAVLLGVSDPGHYRGEAVPAACGSKRWPVKTLVDPRGRMLIQTRPTPATIEQLTSFPDRGKKELLHDEAARIAPQELTVYQVEAVILGFKRESDEDIHIVIADPKNHKRTMVAEIPAGACTPAELGPRFALPQRELGAAVFPAMRSALSGIAAMAKGLVSAPVARSVAASSTSPGIAPTNAAAGFRLSGTWDAAQKASR